ncbi:tRNA(m(1)G37)methyltransferase [Tulasnella sp. 424]|nr:tRNA(m(1)G37)methyltransferase [Tulasnella sp. 424]
MSLDISCPPHHGMTELDRSVFKRTLPVLAVRVPVTKTLEFKKADEVKKCLVDLPNIRNVEPDPDDPANRLVLLSRTEDALPPETRQYISDNGLGFTNFDIKLNYDYWTTSEIIQSVLPYELVADGAPASFAATGHIAHLNLRDEYLPYKHLIGQIVLDKNKNIRTVVNKVNTIDDHDSEFRVFKMEVIAGEPDFNVVLNESDCSFVFDFSKVYWNSRLQAEHKRLIEMFQPGEVIVDGFAGVGPFAVPAAKKGCFVMGSDLNPESAAALKGNAERNKVTNRLRTSCRDGRVFIREAVQEIWDDPIPFSEPSNLAKKRLKEERRARESGNAGARGIGKETEAPLPNPRRRVDHFVMNLPATAIEFLDAYRGVLAPLKEKDPGAFEQVYGDRMPMVHCYAFTREFDVGSAGADLRKRAEEYLGGALGKDGEDVHYHLVRDVAPHKHMYCISFRLPKDIALVVG